MTSSMTSGGMRCAPADPILHAQPEQRMEMAMNRILVACFTLTSLALAAAGCSQSVTPVRGPDGQEWVAVSCSHGEKNCWQAAGEACPLGYDKADEAHSSRGFLFFRRQTNEMLIHCKPPPAVAVLPISPGATPAD